MMMGRSSMSECTRWSMPSLHVHTQCSRCGDDAQMMSSLPMGWQLRLLQPRPTRLLAHGRAADSDSHCHCD